MTTKDEVIAKSHEKCAVCGWGGHVTIIEVHHILPKASEGDDFTTNQIVLCPNHHTLVTALIAGTLKVSDLGEMNPQLEACKTLARACVYLRMIQAARNLGDDNTLHQVKLAMLHVQDRIEQIKLGITWRPH